MIMPRHHPNFFSVKARQRANVRLPARAVAHDFVQGKRAAAVDRETLAAHLCKHAEDIEHWLVNAIARERTEAGEIRLIFELEGPGQRAFQIYSVLLRQIVFTRKARCRIARIHCAVAIGELRPLAGCATFRVGFTDDNGLALQLGIRCHNPKALFDRAQLESVLEICNKCRSLSEAGRTLYGASRGRKTTTNDADRLRKYLARFGLDWSTIPETIGCSAGSLPRSASRR